MKEKAFPGCNLPPEMQEKADRMNLEENLVPPYEPLPPPFDSKTPLAEIIRKSTKIREGFTRTIYGEIPPRCEKLSFRLTSSGQAFDGLAERREIDIVCENHGHSRTLRMLLYLPRRRPGKVPCFLGLNGCGNLSTTKDPGVTFVPFHRYADPSPWLDDGRVGEDQRGLYEHRWQFEKVLSAGFASATVCQWDICADYPNSLHDGILSLFYSREELLSPQRQTACLSAWVWGLQRCLDALESIPEIDSHRLIVHGLSRRGKTTLWLGANDPRPAMLVSCCSGTMGAKMTRRYFGENIEWLDNWHKYWFVPFFPQFIGHDTQIPLDQQQLMALIAPRILYVASAEDDLYADPYGEFLATKVASAAWGQKGLPPDAEFPKPGQAIGNRGVRYFIRPGGHDCNEENWNDILKFAKGKFL
jgi:hypothetical protein